MKKIILTAISLIVISFFTYAQDAEVPYASKMADLGEIQLEYYDYGGEGPTLIILQDFHNYYSGSYALPANHPLINFFNSLTEEFRVIAPLKRGYGQSTDAHWGHDVATLSLDLIDFMDVLDIEKAFFIRTCSGKPGDDMDCRILSQSFIGTYI